MTPVPDNNDPSEKETSKALSRDDILERLQKDAPVPLNDIVEAQEAGTLTEQDFPDVPALRLVTDSAAMAARNIGQVMSGIAGTNAIAASMAERIPTGTLASISESFTKTLGGFTAMPSTGAGIHEAASRWADTLTSVEATLGSLRIPDLPVVPDLAAAMEFPSVSGIDFAAVTSVHNYEFEAIIDVREELVGMTKVLRTAGEQIAPMASVSTGSMVTLI